MATLGRSIAVGVIACLLASSNAHANSYGRFPLLEITERTDVWVRGRLVSVEFRPLQDDQRHQNPADPVHQVMVLCISSGNDDQQSPGHEDARGRAAEVSSGSEGSSHRS